MRWLAAILIAALIAFIVFVLWLAWLAENTA
jgi:hypothetical protein